MNAREKLDEYAEITGMNKNQLIGWSVAADFAEWFAEQKALRQPADCFEKLYNEILSRYATDVDLAFTQMSKSLATIMRECREKLRQSGALPLETDDLGSGMEDYKYHKGTLCEVEFTDGWKAGVVFKSRLSPFPEEEFLRIDVLLENGNIIEACHPDHVRKRQ